MSFLRLLTNRNLMGAEVLAQKEAWAVYDSIRADNRIIFLAEPSEIDVHFRSVTQSDQPNTKDWTDAYLAAFAISAGMRFVSFDKGFKKFNGLDLLLLNE